MAMRYILQKRFAGSHIYAHYGGKFDYLFLPPWLMSEGRRRNFKFNIMPVASAIQVMDVWRRNKWIKWRFLDSHKLIPTSLDKAAKSFGLAGKIAQDLDIDEDDPSWIEYNRVDCVELYQVIEKFHHYIEKVLLGEVGITAPSTAMKLLRRRYLKRPINRNEETHDFVREAYFGGRVEPFECKGENLSYFDVNSSYPASMLHPMPGGMAIWWEHEPPPKRAMKERIGFCDVNVRIPQMHIPPLPVRGSKENGLPKGKLLFPTGNVRGIWEWEELQMALSVGCEIVQWNRSVWYEKVDLFSEFVRDLYQYRDKSKPTYDKGLDEVVKIMLNASYGKFGMKTERRRYYVYHDPELPENAEPANGHPDSEIWYADEKSDAPYVMPQVAARVTALSRVLLYKYMLEAQALGGKIYYCDTDSIITDVQMKTSTGLGGLKDEYPAHAGQLKGVFLGPKLYLLTNDEKKFERVAAKGFQTRDRFTFDSVKEGWTIEMDRLEKVGTLAKEQFARGPRMTSVPRTNKLDTLGKRVVLADGSTEPYSVMMF
jgi:hypothetical protein